MSDEDITTRLLSISEAMYMDRSQEEVDALLLEAKGEIERLDAERDAAIGKRRVWVEWCTRVLRHHRQMIKSAEARADNAEKRCAGLEEALQNMMGCYDTPLSRRRFPPDEFMKEAIETARAALIPQQKGNA